jgi:hypothetical protein
MPCVWLWAAQLCHIVTAEPKASLAPRMPERASSYLAPLNSKIPEPAIEKNGVFSKRLEGHQCKKVLNFLFRVQETQMF